MSQGKYPLGINITSQTLSGSDTRYCSVQGHIRVYAGSVAPPTCHCGAMRYVKHQCECGNVHETEISNDPITAVLRREWDTPEEDAAWKNL